MALKYVWCLYIEVASEYSHQRGLIAVKGHKEQGVQRFFSSLQEVCPVVTPNGGSYTDGHHTSVCPESTET